MRLPSVAALPLLMLALSTNLCLADTEPKIACPPDSKLVKKNLGAYREVDCEDSHGKRNGPHRAYGPRNVLLESGNYLADRQSGTWSYFEDGRKIRETEFREGLQEGADRQWNQNGDLIEEGFYVKGVEQGLQRTFFPGGQEATEHYFSGRGIVERVFDPNGTLLSVGLYDDNHRKVGLWSYYWENGNRRMLEHFQKTAFSEPAESPAFVDLWDESGKTVDAALLPAECVPQLDRKTCNWVDSRVWTAKRPSKAGLLGGVGLGFMGSFRVRERDVDLFEIVDSVVKNARARGCLIAFRGATDRIAVVLTVPTSTSDGRFQEYYRIRIARDASEAPEAGYVIHAAANLVRVPFSGGHRDEAAAQLLDDSFTQSVFDGVETRIKNSGADI